LPNLDVIGSCHDSTDLLAPRLDPILGPLPFNMMVLSFVIVIDPVDRNGSGAAPELDVQFVGKNRPACGNGEFAQDGFAVVAESGGIDCCDLELAAESIEDTGCECFAVDVLCDNDEGTAGLGGGFERREDILQ
jgi:hypothetical protein